MSIEAAIVAAFNIDPPVVGASCATKYPNPSPAGLFVKVRRAGGARRDRVTDMPLVLFECYANNEPAAEALCRGVREWVHSLEDSFVSGLWVRSIVEVGGPVNFPDPDTAQPRYQFSVTIQVRD